MQINLPRSEIARLVHAFLGEQTNFSLGSQTSEQVLAAIQGASYKVLQDCRWVNPLVQITTTIGIAQTVMNYPAGVNAGSITGMAVWGDYNDTFDDGNLRYYAMEKRIIPVAASQDIQQAVGGAPFESIQGRPLYWQELNQIKIWPYTNRQYKVRIEYIQNALLPDDSTMSITDGQLIVYMAASMVATQRENPDQARYMLSLYADRMMALRAWQSAGNRFALDPEADLGEDEFNLDRNVPNWYRGVTISP